VGFLGVVIGPKNQDGAEEDERCIGLASSERS